MERRFFLGLGGAAAAFCGTAAANAAVSAADGSGKSVAAYGLEPNVWIDQSALLQKAVDELAAAGQPIVIPAGRYRVSRVKLPSQAAIFGIPSLTVLSAPAGAAAFECAGAQDISLRGTAFTGTAIIARECANITICDCQILSSGGDGFVCSGSGILVSGNRAASCARAAIWVEGDGMVTGNLVSGQGQFGLRLGSGSRLGNLTVMNNRIDGPAVGIAASSSEKGYALISMNLIVGAQKGAIRALIGEELAGRDLTHGGSEAFRNLAIAANVSI
jgi:hypothetical protein